MCRWRGLLLQVLPSGRKTRRCKHHLTGRREKVTIATYPAFSIRQARDRHEELLALVERGESLATAKRVDERAGGRNGSCSATARRPRQG